LVLAGGYEEAGDRGCFHVQAGDVLLHNAFEAHVDRYDPGGADILELARPFWAAWTHVAMRVTDPDAIMRTVEHNPQEGVALVLAQMQPVDSSVRDWPHQLAVAVGRDPHLRLDTWARERHLANATVSRGFRKVFGVSPSAYRAQQRARRATHFSALSSTNLADLAVCCGFSDQAHMTRAVRALTGRTPGVWRNQIAGPPVK
jgi:AraC-like DNA-binding protein